MRGLARAWAVFRRRGVGFLVYLVAGYLIPKVSYHLLYKVPRLRLRRIVRLGIVGIGVLLLSSLSLAPNSRIGYVKALALVMVLVVVAFLLRLLMARVRVAEALRQARSLSRKVEPTGQNGSWGSWTRAPVDARMREAVEAARTANATDDLVIGRIDQDGRVLGLFGELPGLPAIGEAEFRRRHRFSLDIVLDRDGILVRKDYRGDRQSFLNEWRNLALLSGRANVPALHHVDEDRCRLYRSLVLGKTVREILVAAGARILLAQTADDPQLTGLRGTDRLDVVVARGRALVPSCLSEAFLGEMERQLDLIHACGVTGVSTTFGNVVVDPHTGAPWFIDLEGARYHPSRASLAFVFARDQDRVKFNQRYGRELVTESSARAALVAQAAKLSSWYAPIDFGHGLTIGGFWSTDSGTGRWQFLNGSVLPPLVAGKRVLDLGSNNGLMPLLMLRAGAREVVGVELSPAFVESAILVHRLFEWRDIRPYALRVHEGDMLDILHKDWGKFDVVTAFCTLYYLQADDMARVVRKASELAPVMVVQANTATRKQASEKAETSSLPFLWKLLAENGFPQVEIVAPANYPRPILIGRAASLTL